MGRLKGIGFGFVLFFMTFGQAIAICSDDEISKIYDCYKTNVFDTYNLAMTPSAYIRYYMSAASSGAQYIEPICNTFNRLRTCISEATIRNCMLANEFKRVKFIENPNDANKMVANFLQIDYICGSAKKLVTDKAECALNIPKKCVTTYSNCDNAHAYENCAIRESKNQCGAPAGCFVQKYLSLQTCYMIPTCEICTNIDYNNNPINGMCSEDGNYNSGNNIAINMSLFLSIMFLNFA